MKNLPENEKQDWKAEIESLKEELSKFKFENSTLKMTVGGYKTSNANYRDKVSSLSNDLEAVNKVAERYSKLLKEADELNECRIETIAQLNKKISSLEKEKSVLIDELTWAQKPWWKKIF